jgi:hypothetical protein
MGDDLLYRFYKTVEVFFVQEDLMPLIAIVIKFLCALRQCDIKVFTFRPPHIEKIGSAFSGFYFARINAFEFPGVILVFHDRNI